MLGLTKEEKTVIVFVLACLLAGTGIDFVRKRCSVVKETAIADCLAGGSESPDKKININTADMNELMTIKGIGVKTAERIIDYRSQNGPFISADDIMRVKGFGEKRFEKIREYIVAE